MTLKRAQLDEANKNLIALQSSQQVSFVFCGSVVILLIIF